MFCQTTESALFGCDCVSRFHTATLFQYGVRVIDEVTIEPITLAEAKLHLRVDDDGGSPPSHPDDTLITAQIRAAREWCEGYLGLSLATQTLEVGRSGYVDRWSGSGIMLPYGPVISISSVMYRDSDGVDQTVPPSDYVIDTFSAPYATSVLDLPSAYTLPNAVKVQYVAGYSLPGASPQDTSPLPWSLRAMILVVLGHLYENREETTELKLMELPLGAKALGDRYRVRLGFA